MEARTHGEGGSLGIEVSERVCVVVVVVCGGGR